MGTVGVTSHAEGRRGTPGGNWSGLGEISEHSALLQEHVTRAQGVCWTAQGVLSTDPGSCRERSGIPE